MLLDGINLIARSPEVQKNLQRHLSFLLTDLEEVANIYFGFLHLFIARGERCPTFFVLLTLLLVTIT